MQKRKNQTIPPSINVVSYLCGKLGIGIADEIAEVVASQCISMTSRGIVKTVEELCKYLCLLSEYKNNSEIRVSPSRKVDQALHALLLDPVLYYRVCDEILLLMGKDSIMRPIRVLPHAPLNGEDEVSRDRRYNFTLSEYEELFGTKAPQNLWPSEYWVSLIIVQ